MKTAFELSSKKNSDGLYPIYLRIQDSNGKKRRVKANYAVLKNQFKSKNHNFQWVRNHPNNKAINADLKAQLESYNDVLSATINQGKLVTPETLIQKATRVSVSGSFIQYFELKISQMLEYNQRKGYVQVLNNWKAYIKKEKLGDLDFRQISVYVLKGFENFLFGKELESSTVYSNLKRIRSLFNQAIKEDLLSPGDYIFKAYTMPKVKATKKEKLTIEELRAFSEQDYERGSLSRNIQQAFLLAFHLAGVRIEDVLTLKWIYVKNGRIEYQMKKTGSLNSFLITPQINAILEYYKSLNLKSQYIVPILEDGVEEEANEIYKKEIGRKTALVNKYLKSIASDAGITKKVSSHISRHTFASIAIKRSNGDVYFVQNALKHSSSKITQTYLASLDNESMDEKMKSVTII